MYELILLHLNNSIVPVDLFQDIVLYLVCVTLCTYEWVKFYTISSTKGCLDVLFLLVNNFRVNIQSKQIVKYKKSTNAELLPNNKSRTSKFVPYEHW